MGSRKRQLDLEEALPTKKHKPNEFEGEDSEDMDDDDDEEEDEEDEGQEGYRDGGYHPVSIGEIYNRRYKIIKKLGWGHFSTVWLASDASTEQHVALKIVKSASHYTEAALDEIQLLNASSKHDPQDLKHIVRLLDHFSHTGPHGNHIVMVFEVLGKHLLDLIEKNYKGLPLTVVKSIARQILVGLDFLHTKPGIIHTDLKPENILMVESFQYENGEMEKDVTPVTRVKIADLGNACWVDKHFTDDIQTRQYRAPEVILGYPYDSSADLWSLGCILFELATGDLLFKPKKGTVHGKSEDHLAMILELVGATKLPVKMMKGKKAPKYFGKNRQLINIKKLKHWGLQDILEEKYHFTPKDAKTVASFLNKMVCLDGAKRFSAKEALKHPFLAKSSIDVPFPLDT